MKGQDQCITVGHTFWIASAFFGYCWFGVFNNVLQLLSTAVMLTRT